MRPEFMDIQRIRAEHYAKQERERLIAQGLLPPDEVKEEAPAEEANPAPAAEAAPVPVEAEEAAPAPQDTDEATKAAKGRRKA